MSNEAVTVPSPGSGDERILMDGFVGIAVPRWGNRLIPVYDL